MDGSQRGSINKLVLPLALVVLLLLGSLGFGAWAYGSRADYKNTSDQKVAAAVALAKQQTQAADVITAANAAKSPLKTWTGPSQYGNFAIQYPKTWSGYVVQTNSQTVVDDYFYPDVVPSVNDPSNSYALRLQIINQAYDQVLIQYGGQVKSGTLKSSPFAFAKVPSVVGTRLDGAITPTKHGSLVLIPLRNITVVVWTESSDYLSDFNNSILPSVTFSP